MGRSGARHRVKLLARPTQPSPRAAPSARTATPEGASNARRTWHVEVRDGVPSRGLSESYVERCWLARTWPFEPNGFAVRRGLSGSGEQIGPVPRGRLPAP